MLEDVQHLRIAPEGVRGSHSPNLWFSCLPPQVTELPVRTARFVARKQWIVCGSDDMFIRVLNYNTSELVGAPRSRCVCLLRIECVRLRRVGSCAPCAIVVSGLLRAQI